jgi:predicted DNA-binding transcriptional regulator AlpA
MASKLLKVAEGFNLLKTKELKKLLVINKLTRYEFYKDKELPMNSTNEKVFRNMM